MRGFLVLAVAFVAGGALSPLAVSAQSPGERVRVTLASERIVGVVSESRPGELVVTGPRGGPWIVAHDEIQRLERSLGQRSQWRRGLLYGALSGVALAGVNAILVGDDEPGGFLNFSAADRFVLGSVLFGGVGGGIGTVVGAFLKREGWQAVEDWSPRGMTPGLMLDFSTGSREGRTLVIGGQLRF